MVGENRFVAGLQYALVAVGGLVVAVIVVLNLHIVVGLEQGYAASPRDVIDRSPLLALVDLALLVAGPVSAIVGLARVRRRSRDLR